MTTQSQPAYVYFDQALREEYRKPENTSDQVTNILLGLFRFATTLWVHALSLTAVLILFLLCVTPETLTPLWASTQYRAEQIESVAPPYLAGEEDSYEPDPIQERLPAHLDAALPSSEPVTEARLDAKNDISLETTPQQVLIQQPSSLQPVWHSRVQEREEATSVLKNLLRIATFCAFFVGVFCNTGRFTWVYRDRAWARVNAAQQLRERMAICQQAAASVLAQQRESARNNGQEAV